MAEKLTKRDARSPASFRTNVPRGQISLYVIIQRDPPLLHQAHCTERENRLAHRPGLKQGISVDRLGSVIHAHAESALPGNATAVDYSYADSR